MTDAPRRKRLRLQGFDYSQGGGYYLTIEVLDRRCLFGEVHSREMELNEFGKQVAAVWVALAERYEGLIVDEWILMPDHLHGILVLTSIEPDVKLPNVVDVVSYFKSVTTRLYHRYKEEHGLVDWPPQLWQRSYYERVIRSESDLHEKRSYIRTNPERWTLKRQGLR